MSRAEAPLLAASAVHEIDAMPRDDEPNELVSLRERTRISVDVEQRKTAHTTVHCPIHADAQTAEHCRACPRFESERQDVLTCRVPASVAAPIGVVGELVGARSVCLDGELPVAAGSELLAQHDATVAPVVDDHHVLVGVVTARDLMRAQLQEAQLQSVSSLISVAEVEDVMVTEATALEESMPVAEAARLMSERGLRSVPVVNARGEVVGVLDAMDFVRFVASRSGK